MHEVRDLAGVRRAIGIEHHDDVAGGGLEPAAECGALALTLLHDDLDVGQQLAGNFDCSVGRMPVDEDHLVD